MARSFFAPLFGRRPIRWIAAASVASLVVVSLCLSRPAIAAKGRTQVDPWAVPDGPASKLVDFINKMRHMEPPKTAQTQPQEKHSFLVRTHTLMLQAADKLLAGNPSPGQRTIAFKAKYDAVMLLREPTGEQPPNDQQLTELVKQLKGESDPESVKLFNQGTFTLKLSALARADKDTPKVWDEIKADLTANPPDRGKLKEVEEAARRIERFQTSEANLELLSKVYVDLLGIALNNPQPGTSDIIKRIGCVARRLTLVGKPAIEIKGRTVSGKAFDWSTTAGKVVLIEFWSPEIQLSVGQIPLIKKAMETYHDKGLEVVSVCVGDDEKQKLNQFITDQKITWPVLFGDSKATRGLNHPMAQIYGINGAPTGILVNRNGLVVSIVARDEGLERLLKALFIGGAIERRDVVGGAAPNGQAPVVVSDPFEVPNGKPAELLAFINKMEKTDTASGKDATDEARQMALGSRKAIVKAANKILSARPDDTTVAKATISKINALSVINNLDHSAETEKALHDFAEQLVREGKPGLATTGQRFLLVLRIRNFNGSPDEAGKLLSDTKGFLAVSPNSFSLLEGLAAKLASSPESCYPAAADAYRTLADIARKGPNNEAYVKHAEGNVHRLGLLGHSIEFQGTLLGGQPFDADSLKGKVVLVDFWASWCGPCRAELPNILENYKKYHSKGLEVIGVSLDQNKDDLQKFLAEDKLPWPILFSNNPQEQYWNHPMSQYYGIDSIPRLFLQNEKGEVVSLDARGPQLGRRLEQLLGSGAAGNKQSSTEPSGAEDGKQSSTQPAGQWKPFTYEKGGFTASFPGEPTHFAVVPHDSGVGKVSPESFFCSQNEGVLDVTYADIPLKQNPDLLKDFDHEAALDKDVKIFVESSRGELIKETKISYGKWAGRELLIGPTVGHEVERTCRIYYIGKRQFTLCATGATGKKPAEADIRKFFDSFKVTDE